MIAWKSLLRRPKPGHVDGPFVTLSGRRPALTLLETWLAAELSDESVAAYSELVDRLAERWFREELRDGSATVDLGLWAPGRLRSELRSFLAELEGDFLAILPPAFASLAEPGNRAEPVGR